MIDGVIFDKDGTLFDFRASWGAWAAALLRGLAETEAQARTLGQAIGYDLETGVFAPDSPVIAATPDEIADEMLPHLPGLTHHALLERMNTLAAGAPMLPAVPLRVVLGDLRARGLKIGLATNDAEAPAHAHLAGAGVSDLFDFVAGFDSGHGAKPAPGQLLAFARRLSLDPSRVVMVGDSRHDLQAGRAAGMRTVAVLTGIAEASELAPHADVVMADIGGLGAWIDALVPA
ncbi:MAG: HAD family hydrolase [Pseudomonadota bacterium]